MLYISAIFCCPPVKTTMHTHEIGVTNIPRRCSVNLAMSLSNREGKHADVSMVIYIVLQPSSG